jgi:hypothetical protein
MRLAEHPTIEFEDDWYFTERYMPLHGGNVRIVLDPRRKHALASFSRYETNDTDVVSLDWGQSPVQWAHVIRDAFREYS